MSKYQAYAPQIAKGKICLKCGTNYRYIETGKCANCCRKSHQDHSNMEMVNKRRKLLKEKELREIDNNHYFED